MFSRGWWLRWSGPEARNAMNHARGRGLRAPGGANAGEPWSDDLCRNVSRDDNRSSAAKGVRQLARAFVALLFGLSKPLLQIAAWTAFRRIITLHAERFPHHGAVLVAANHPAAWTDVVVLDVALRRKLHFITAEPLFQPWWRGLLLRLFGSLPVRFGHDPHDGATNRETFDRCHALFQRGEVVAFFPEGVSFDDRTLAPLRPGTARLALEAARAGTALCLVPVALHYENRMAFRSDVRIAVGSAIPIPMGGDDGEEGARSLTGRIAVRLEALLDSAEQDARASRIASDPPRRRTLRGTILAILGVIGMIVHAIPAVVIETAARRFAPAPQQAMLARIVGGFVVLPIAYLALAMLARNAGLPSAVVVAAPLLGLAACRLVDQRKDRVRRGVRP